MSASMDDEKLLEAEIARLKDELAAKEAELNTLRLGNVTNNSPCNEFINTEDIVRFSRQIILPQIGVSGQQKLKKARVLVVGAGGLGCPVLLYLAKAGVGHITVIDSDTVEVSNLHRQVLHTDSTIGLSKVESALKFFSQDNGYTKVKPICGRFTPANSDILVSQSDLVVDASDNVGTRYLLNDACVRNNKPLVSGSALGLEGQVTVYNSTVKKDGSLLKGPCYRCLFPTPPPANSAASCSQSGVLGAVPGLIGLIQSIEVVKLIVDWPQSNTLAGKMIIFDANDLAIRTVKLRLASEKCPACGPEKLQNLPYYVEMCGEDTPVDLLKVDERITPETVKREKSQLLLIDVRTSGEFGMCSIEGSHNYPYNDLEQSVGDIKNNFLAAKEQNPNLRICCICRRGNDSQLAAARLKEVLPNFEICDMKGGLHNWAKCVDPKFPVY